MDVRDAVEADADRLAELTGSPRDVMRNLVHDRTVRVIDADSDAPGAASGDQSRDSDHGNGEINEDAGPPIRGFVSYDAREETVHITQLEGDGGACDRLLDEPVRFAERENMDVELLVPEDETGTRDAAEDAGFEHAGAGPTFEGQPTVRYRLDPR